MRLLSPFVVQFSFCVGKSVRPKVAPEPPTLKGSAYEFDSSQLISHGIPKRSTTCPKRTAQNVCWSGMMTRPSFASS